MRALGLQQSFCLGRLFVRAWSLRLGKGDGSITLTLPAGGRLLRSSRSLQGNVVPPQPVVHRPDIASELGRDVLSTAVSLHVQIAEQLLGEDVTVSDSARSKVRTDFVQPLVNRRGAHMESLRDVTNGCAPAIQRLNELARERQSATVLCPSFPRRSGPSHDGHIVRGRRVLNFHLFRNRTA